MRSATYKPLTRPLFLYINTDSIAKKPQLVAFVQDYLNNMKNWVPFVGYVPLSDIGYQLALARFQQRVTGSLYDGQITVGVSPEAVLQQATVN